MGALKTRIHFENSLDSGCDISEEEMASYVSEVESAIAEVYPDAQIVCTDTHGCTRVHRDGHRDYDLEQLAQSVWEGGNFWQ